MKWYSVDIEERGTRYDPLSLVGSIFDLTMGGIRSYGSGSLVECHQLGVL